MFYFHYLIEYVFTVSLLSLQNVYYYDSVYVLSSRSRINPDQYVYEFVNARYLSVQDFHPLKQLHLLGMRLCIFPLQTTQVLSFGVD